MNVSEIVDAYKSHCRSLLPEIPENVLAFKDIAVNYFGEENVDLQFTFDQDSLYQLIFSNYVRYGLQYFGMTAADFPEHTVTDTDLARWIEEMGISEFFSRVTLDKLQIGSLPLYALLIKFSNFHVTNENEQSVPIEEFFVMYHINYSGKLVGRPKWARTKVSALHYEARYLHSHVSTSGEEDFLRWHSPCLGSGPINMTIQSLEENFDEELARLLCYETDLCVRTESLTGGPYYRLASISVEKYNDELLVNFRSPFKCDNDIDPVLKEIIKSLLEEKALKWTWSNGVIMPAVSFTDLYMLISKAAVDIFGKQHSSLESFEREFIPGLFFYGSITDNGYIKKLKLSQISNSVEVALNWEFKGQPQKLEVLNTQVANVNKYLFLNHGSASYIYRILIKTVNVSYGKSYNAKAGIAPAVY